MVKKVLLSTCFFAILFSAGNVNLKTANAEETSSTEKAIEKGNISKYFVNNDGYVDMTTDEKIEKITDYYTVNRAGDFTTVSWNTDIMDNIFESKTAIAPDVFHKSTDEDNQLQVNGQKTSYCEVGGGYYTLISQKVAPNMVFDDWNSAIAQPFEFVFEIDEDLFLSGPRPNLHDMLYFLDTYLDYDFNLPILRIDGETILELNKTDNKLSFNYYNSRVYLGYGPIELDMSTHSYNYGYNGVFFVEIPFKKYIETIEVIQFEHWTDEEVFHSEPVDGYVANTIFIDPNIGRHSKFSPFNFSNVDFENGQLTAISGTAPLRTKTTFGYITDYFNLGYIILGNSDVNIEPIVVYTKLANSQAHTYNRELIYNLYSDKNCLQKFSYSNNSSNFFKKLNTSSENVKFYITHYSYSFIFSAKDLSKNLHDMFDITLRPNGYKDKVLQARDIESLLGFDPRPKLKKNTRFANSDSNEITEDDSSIVDCGTYYGFEKVNKEQIHTVSFDTIHAKNIFYTRLAFSAYDNDVRMYIRKINALWFKYSFNNKEYNFTINTKDFTGISGGDQYESILDWLLTPVDENPNQDNTVTKTDKNTHVTFNLAGMKRTDYICFNWQDYNPQLRHTDNKDMFLIYTKQDIKFENVVSCIYVDKAGEIVNASENLPDGTEAPTVIIGEDGSVTVWDKHGNQIDGTVDSDGNFVRSDGTIRENANNVDNSHDKTGQEKWEEFLETLKKALALIPTIAIGIGVVWLIGTLGPSIISLFKKKD